MKELVNKVVQWGYDKGIIGKATPLDQFKKTAEEANELRLALIAQSNNKKTFINEKGREANTAYEIKDAIGDITVTLILQAELQGLYFEDCLQSAYDIISKRTGKMVNGQFVKDK